MTWQLATFTGLALVLVGGFWWFERTRPGARLVALVAALAALAVAGRLVLTPIPNVVATTDIALITGYALGAGPGFAVGALAAPISNIWLGQGPWTAWEMAGWGLVGLGGAWLAAATRRRLGRLGLAVACAAAGLAYGALLDLSVMVTYGGEQSLDRYLALSARGAPFNIAHATGNFVIALAAGPALVRMISRFRTRLEFDWRPAGAISLLLVALVAAGAAGGAGSSEAAADAKVPASSWLARAQNDDGGFSATPGQTSSPAMTGWAMLGLEAVGTNPLDLRKGAETPVSYLRSETSRLRSVGDLERTILALVGAGLDPHRFASADLVAQLRKRLDRDGSVDGQVNLTAFYALAMRAAGAGTGSLKRPAAWLRAAQNGDGAWGIQPQAPSEADSTGAALQGLAAAGARGRASARGAAWLRRAQRSSGGWALAGTGVVNSQSTAWAVQGLAAIGGGAHSIHGALGYLGHLRAPDGHYRYSASSDQTPIWVTAQVLLAVERRPFPLAAVPRAPTRNRGDNARSGAGGGASASAGAASPSQATGSVPSTGGGQGVAPPPPSSGTGSGADTPTQSPATGGGNTSAPAGGGSTATPAGGTSAATPGVEPGASAPDASPGTDPVPVSVAYESDGSSGGDSTGVVVVAIAVLAAFAAAGLFWYRRRTP